ncbi:MAG: ABC transporter substrate-binding protein [Acidimicrobiaceae bacterium]|nr:ABC transporter substrate-binding protein [Acidimicrobiaceae bacterium]
MNGPRGRLLLSLALILSTAGLVSGAGAGQASAQTGGSLVVLEPAATWAELDPATNTADAGDQDIMNAIYGELFEQGPHGTLVPDLATGYKFSNGSKTVTISLRPGVKFSDGTPFDAQAVTASIQRDLNPKNACLCISDFSDVTSVTAEGNDKVQLHLKAPFAPIMEAFVDEAPNWTVSPTALAKMGTNAFAQKPVGAGPFTVASNSASVKLALKKNPLYWKKGEPLLDNLTFQSANSTQTALEALQSGAAQVIDPDTDPASLLLAAKDGFKVYNSAPRSANWVQINPTIAPFNNLKAREAIYYATDSAALLKVIGDNYGTVAEAPTGSGDRFFEKTVPGYRTYNLAKAKALVQQLGGLTFTLVDVTSPTSQPLMEALQTEYRAAGMNVTLGLDSLTTIVGLYQHNSWEISLEGGGEVDPALGVGGFGTRFDGFLGNVKDPTLNSLIAQSTATTNNATRKKLTFEIYKRISDQAYGPYLYVTPFAAVAAKSVKGMTVQTGPIGAIVNWEKVSV